jgi:hypothetical protein
MKWQGMRQGVGSCSSVLSPLGENREQLPSDLNSVLKTGQFYCDDCGARFDTSVGVAKHKLNCEGVTPINGPG